MHHEWGQVHVWEGEGMMHAKVISFMHHEWGQVHVWEGEGMMMPK